VTAVVQAESMGTSLGTTLRVQAEAVRLARKQRAEQAAQKARDQDHHRARVAGISGDVHRDSRTCRHQLHAEWGNSLTRLMRATVFATRRLLRSDQRGQALVIFAASAFVIFAVLGLVLDGSNLQLNRRKLQNAADAAAYAGAYRLPVNPDQATIDSVAVAHQEWQQYHRGCDQRGQHKPERDSQRHHHRLAAAQRLLFGDESDGTDQR